MRLANQTVKSLGTIFSGENLVTHTFNLMRELNAKTEKNCMAGASPADRGWQPKRLPYNVRSFWLSVGRWTLSVGRF
jgi:hypothetical protein